MDGDTDYIERVIYGADIPFTEIDTDQSIDERAKKHYNKPYYVNGIDLTPAYIEGYELGATEQDLISKAREKEFAKWCFLNNYYYLRGVWKHIDFNLRVSEHYQKIFTTEELFNQFTNR